MILFTRILSILSLLLYFTNAESRKFRFDYTYREDIDGWIKLHRTPVTWNEARLRCHAEGAVLASPFTEAFRRMMMTLATLNNNTQFGTFTGVHATLHKGVYTSIEGVPLSRMPIRWAMDEPDNYENNEDCLLFMPDGTMADVNCNKTFPFMCYKKKTANLVTTACGFSDANYYLEPQTGSCYKFHHICQTWHRAYMTCESEGGHLAIINSKTEAQVLKELYAKNLIISPPCDNKDMAMLGFLDWNREKYWTTIHSETLEDAGYASWSLFQPDYVTLTPRPQSCGAMFRSGLLGNVQCEVALYPFICEKTPDSLEEK
ncbi:macrophage mannose receptor 1-like [Galleria mellonella]|uniref:Macrophage mannose receptor 1-like n=1 Tax=Galleria mellonella TaxID=7137 RepID=A0ABM3N700_GALME|nr:macrophage mannose receptor 1-like [Galleria mellonella]